MIGKKEKDISEFYKNTADITILDEWCKSCVRVSGYWREHYQKYAEHQKERKRRHYKENPEIYKKARKKYYQKNCKQIRAKENQRYRQDPIARFRKGLTKLTDGTGLTTIEIYEFYSEKFAEQNGCCAICGRHEAEFKFRLNIDHCHKTGKLRGLICTNCNSGIGNLQDDAELLLKAYDYLRKH